MDAYELSQRIFQGWVQLYPKSSGQIVKPNQPIEVYVETSEGARIVTGVVMVDGKIRLLLDTE